MDEFLDCLTQSAVLLPETDVLVDRDRLLEVFRRTIHILHLPLDQVYLPIELVEHGMEGVEHTLVFVDLDQVGLELLLAIVVRTMLVCSVSLVHEGGSTERFCLERERVFKTFSVSDSTVLPGVTCSSLHIFAAMCDFISDFSFILSISVWSS